jgi:hypothetical protein
MNKHFKFYLIASTVVNLILLCAVLAWADDYTNEQYADAIYLAEGGVNAKKPYGILSVKCETEQECRKICINTVRNNKRRFKSYGHNDYNRYIEFLASRYAPIGAKNDPQNLNRNWIKNVTYFLNKGDQS